MSNQDNYNLVVEKSYIIVYITKKSEIQSKNITRDYQ